jgi:uncharacterized protein
MAAVDGPSFDCAKAATEVELAICASDRLSTQDLDLLDAYKAARDSGATTRDDQRSWIRQRNSQCGGNVDCLYQVNQARIDDLNGTGATPNRQTHSLLLPRATSVWPMKFKSKARTTLAMLLS